MKSRKQEHAPGLLDTLRSLQFGIVVLIAIATVAIAGTILPQGESPEFYTETYGSLIAAVVGIFHLDVTYSSPLFIGLMGLFGLNLVLCTLHRFPGVMKTAFRPNDTPSREELLALPIHASIQGASLDNAERAFRGAGFGMKRTGENRLFAERGRLGHLGATVVHLSLLLLLAGGMTSLLTGRRGHIVLRPGEDASLAVLGNGAKIPLGFTLRLDSFRAEYYANHPERPKSFTSSVTVIPFEGTPFHREIRVNHPLIRNGLTVYQSSFGLDDAGPSSAANDTARIEIRLKGAPGTMPPVTTVAMTTGGVYPLPGFGDTVQVRIADIQRNFRMGGDGEENPAVKIDVLVRGAVRWSVYAFKNYPGLNMPMHNDIDFQFVLLDLLPGSPAAGAEPAYYTVLGVVRDRGVPVVWAGALFLVAGLALSLYIRPRRIWVLAENGAIHVGARAKGDDTALRSSIEDAVKRIKP